MRFLATLVGLFLVTSLCDAALVQRRTYRNTEEILVPVTIIQDGEEIKEPVDLREKEEATEIKSLESEVIAENIASAVEEEQKLEAVEAVAEAQRRIDEAIIEEEIEEAAQEEQNKKVLKVLENEKELGTRTAEATDNVHYESNQAIQESPATEVEPQTVHYESNEANQETPAQEVDPQIGHNESNADIQATPEVDQNEIASATEQLKASDSVVATQEDANREPIANGEAAQQPEVSVRQATQATPTATSTQQTFIQFLQNSPLGQFFNQQNGSNPSPFPAFPTFPTLPTLPTLPAFPNPFATAQSFISNATQGFQQFTSNIQSNFPNFGGQQQGSNATTARPGGPLQQFLANFGQPNPSQQGPFQGFISFFQGNNRIQEPAPATTTSPEPQPAREPEIQEQTPEELSNNYAEDNDSFEESVQPAQLIVVSDGDASEVETNQPQGYPSVPY